jgi:hypothetical protein
LYEIHPDARRIRTPTPSPDYLKRMGKVNIVPPIMELTSAQIVRQEGFNWLIIII